MRVKTVKRYYCDFCSKAQMRRDSMERHEKHCTANPNRQCQMCEHAYHPEGGPPSTQSLMDRLEAFRTGGMKKLREFVCDCPACILATIRPITKQAMKFSAEELPQSVNDLFAFDFKKEVDQFWSDHPRPIPEYYYYV